MAVVLTRTTQTVEYVYSADPAIAAGGDPAMLPATGQPPAATRFGLRALSWLEDQALRDAVAADQVLGYVRTAVVAVDGGDPAAFLADPNPALVLPLYRAAVDLTWGNR